MKRIDATSRTICKLLDAAKFSIDSYQRAKGGHKKHLKRQRAKKQNELLPAVSEPGVFLGRLNSQGLYSKHRD
jgi:hypothetical protein